MQRLKTSAIVLRTVDYGESDRVVSLFSLQRGKLSVFARGARASRRRFGGALEPFTLVDAELKGQRDGELMSLESVAVVRAFGGIRSDLARIACASYACELARESVRDHEPHRDLFDLLVEYLSRLETGPARPWMLRAFELGALRAGGIMPCLEDCARCGNRLAATPSEQLVFDAGQGGFLCRDCGVSRASGTLAATLETAIALARLQRNGLPAAEGESPTRAVGVEARDLLSVFIEHHLGKRLASRKFIDEMGPVLGG